VVQLSTRLEFFINLRAMKALGIAPPITLLAPSRRGDRMRPMRAPSRASEVVSEQRSSPPT
jgi:hypothetical protein